MAVVKSEPISLENKEPIDCSVLQLVTKLFKSDVTATYPKQENIAFEISKKFNCSKPDQSAISKAMKKLLGVRLTVNNKHYRVTKGKQGYYLCSCNNVVEEVVNDFFEYDVLANYEVFGIKNAMVGYSVKKNCYKRIKEIVKSLYGQDAFFDICKHGDKVYFYTNDEKLYSDLLSIPKLVKEEETRSKTPSHMRGSKKK